MSSTIAVLCSDLHLCHTAPASRSVEPDWYAAMQRPVEQIRAIATELDVPVICGGDVFDKWHCPNELVNWALHYLPNMYSVPGQHDLPHHNMKEIRRSAYWTLVEAGKIMNLNGVARKIGDSIFTLGCGWETEIPKDHDRMADRVNLITLHRYVWKAGYGFPGAPVEARAGILGKSLEGYDVALFGDNHKGFSVRTKTGCLIWNNGAMMNRHSDEQQSQPRVGLLQEDGTVEERLLDVSDDLWVDMGEDVPVDDNVEMTELLDKLKKLGPDSLNFRKTVREYLQGNDEPPAVQKMLLESIGE